MSAQPMPPARRDPTALTAIRRLDDAPPRTVGEWRTGPMVEAFRRALEYPAASFKLADDVWGCIREFEAF